MSTNEYVVLRPMLTDAGGRANVEYRVGDPITIEEEDRATYLLDALFIARAGGEKPSSVASAETSDAPEREELDLSDDDEPAADPDEEPKPAPRRTRRAG